MLVGACVAAPIDVVQKCYGFYHFYPLLFIYTLHGYTTRALESVILSREFAFLLIYPTYIYNCTCVTLTIWWSVMCYPNKVDNIYMPILTQYYLYRLRRSGHIHFRLNHAAWRAACEAGVALHRPNRRGSRFHATESCPLWHQLY